MNDPTGSNPNDHHKVWQVGLDARFLIWNNQTMLFERNPDGTFVEFETREEAVKVVEEFEK